MADFNKLDLGSTEDFSLETHSELEDFLNGDTSKIEKIDPKKDQKKEEKSKDPKSPVKKAEKQKEDEDTEDEQVEEEDVDVLEDLSKEEEDEEEDKTPKASKKKEETIEENSTGSPEENPFEVISRQLYDAGIFSHEDEETEAPVAASAEELLALFQDNSQRSALRQLDNFLRSRGDDRMDLFEAIFVNGVDPKEYLPTYNRVQSFENLDITNEANQEKVVREYYSRLKWSPEKIETKVQKLKDYGDLEDEATEVHSKIVDQDKEELERQKLQKQQEEQTKKATETAYQQGVRKTLVDALKEKELSGIPITEAKAKEVMGYLLQPKYRLPNGETISEFDKYFLESKKPENIKDRVVFALLKLNGFDFSKIEKKAISTKTNELFAGLKKTAVKSKNEKVIQKDNFWDNL